MKKTIIAAVSAFFLALGAAHAEEGRLITYEDICAMTKPGAPPIPEAKKNELLLYVAKDAGIFCMDGEQSGAVKLLLEAGADPNAVDSEGKVLPMWHCTIDAGRVAKVEVDLERREYVLSQTGANGETGKREKMSDFDFAADEVGFENNCELYYHPAREEWKRFYLRWSAYVL